MGLYYIVGRGGVKENWRIGVFWGAPTKCGSWLMRDISSRPRPRPRRRIALSPPAGASRRGGCRFPRAEALAITHIFSAEVLGDRVVEQGNMPGASCALKPQRGEV